MKEMEMLYQQKKKGKDKMSKRIISQDGISRPEESYEFLLAGNRILAVGHNLEDEVTEQEDCTGSGLKDHIVELGIYDSEEKAHVVWILLHSWINGNLNKGDNLFYMPKYSDHVFVQDGRMIIEEDLLERFGECENIEGGTEE